MPQHAAGGAFCQLPQAKSIREEPPDAAAPLKNPCCLSPPAPPPPYSIRTRKTSCQFSAKPSLDCKNFLLATEKVARVSLHEPF